MKNITKYILAAAAAFSSLTACQEFEDFDKTIDGTPGLVYVQTGTENLYTIRVVHKPTGSTGEFFTEFPVRCNTTRHAGVKATFVYDASLVESYNAEHKTSYAALPAEYLTLENTTLTVPENATASADSVKVTLTGDLSLLTERNYLAPLRIKAEGIDASEVMGAVYVAVATEINLIRAIESTDDMVGFTATGRSAWTADCGNYANLFDGSTSTSVDFPEQYGNVLNIDMKEQQLVTGLCLGYGSVPSVSIEYSADGENFSQAGTPVAGEYVTGGSRMYAAFHGHIEARYLRLTVGFSSSWSKTLSEIDIYKIDSEDPTVYAVTGTENLITGKITHRQTGSTSDVNASFSAYATVASTSGYTVSVAADNSLVAAYNTAHGTSYAALPAEYLQLDNNPLTIAAGTYKSEGEVTVSLKGDLTRLGDLNGYLAPLKLSSSGAGTSAGRGVVYLAVKVERNKIRPITSADDMVGFPAAGRTAWTADCPDYANLFDGSTSTRTNFTSQNDNVVTIDMKSTHMVTGIDLNSAGISSVSFEYSTDGQTFLTAGTPASNEYATSGSNRYIAFYDYLEARYLRLTISFSSSWSKYVSEFNIYEIESDEPTVYAMCGSDNVLTGAIAHTPGGSFNQLNAAFNVYCTVSSASGYSVSATPDNSLIAAYNSANGTSYAALPDGHLLLENNPCAIGPNNNKSDGQIKASLTGDLTGLTNAKGYLVPLKLSAQDAVTSSGRGVVYLVIIPAEELFRKNFTVADITGALVADRSGWSITGGDYHSGSWPEVIDDSTDTFMRPWGSPIMFTITFDKEYEMTGLRITARTDNASYQNYQPNAITIEYSLNGEDYTELGTAASADGSLLKNVPSSYVALYGSQKMKYIRITASYGSNMGVGDFNIYANKPKQSYEIQSYSFRIGALRGRTGRRLPEIAGIFDVVYFTGTENSNITNMYVDGPSSMGVTVTSSCKMAADVQVSLAVDAAAVDAYNALHGTDYRMLPAGSYRLSDEAVTIAEGTNVSTPSSFEIVSMDDLTKAQTTACR